MKTTEAGDAASRFERCVFAFEQEFNYLNAVLRRNGVAPADVEDLVQEVFVVMWRRWPDFQVDRPLRPWLAGIAVNLAWRSVARRRREVPEGFMDIEETLSPLDDRVAARTLVTRALAEVPANNRAVVILHDLEGLSMRDVADSVAVPLATAYTRLGRGRKAFATAVRKLQNGGSAKVRVRSVALVGPPAGLLEIVRGDVAPAPGGELRRRVLARARSLSGKAGMELGAAPRIFIRSLGVAAGAGLLLLLGMLSLPLDGSRSESDHVPVVLPAEDQAATPRARGVASQLRIANHPQLILAATLPSAITDLASGVTGYWRFDDGPLSVRPRDLSGHGRDCAFRGINLADAWTEGKQGGALRLVDTTGWVTCPFGREGGSADAEITVAAWVRLMHTKRYAQAIVSRQRADDNATHYMLGAQSRNVILMSDAWNVSLAHPVPRSVRAWTHVAFTHADDGTTRLFMDGVEVAAAIAAPAREVVLRDVITLGFSTDPVTKHSARRFRGDLDELLIYDRVLSRAEIAALASGTQPSPAPPSLPPSPLASE